MATEKQVKMIRAKQRAVGGRLATRNQILRMRHDTIQIWVSLLNDGINPYDHTEGESAVKRPRV
jgi:hypothetical protein